MVLTALWALALPLPPQAVAAPAAPPKADTKKFNPAELTQGLDAVADAQRSLAATLFQLRDQLTDVQRGLSELREELRLNRDAIQSGLDQTKGMREEVRGLYVESSGLKGDIAQVGKQVESVDNSLNNFRLSSGIVVAVVVLLQVVLIGLMFRGRG